MAVAMRDKTDGMSLTARYNVSALAFGKEIRVQMKERYKTDIAFHRRHGVARARVCSENFGAVQPRGALQLPHRDQCMDVDS